MKAIVTMFLQDGLRVAYDREYRDDLRYVNGGTLHNRVHALALHTYTLKEWEGLRY